MVSVPVPASNNLVVRTNVSINSMFFFSIFKSLVSWGNSRDFVILIYSKDRIKCQ